MRMEPKHAGIDLIIADVPEDLPVPIVNPDFVPPWNTREEDYLENVFVFADYNLTDDGVILLMHARDRKIEEELEEHALEYDFKVVRDWWGFNQLRLSSKLYANKTVSHALF